MTRPVSALALLLAGCNTTLGAQVIQQRDAFGHVVQRHCQAARWPQHLPALVAVLDSAALWSALHARPDGDTTSIVFSIVYRPDGTAAVHLVQLDTVLHAVDISFLEVLSQGVRSTITPAPFGAIRIKVQGGPAGTATVARSVYCPPERPPSDTPRTQRALVYASPGDRMPTVGQKIRFVAETSINETGFVTNVELVIGTGVRELDETIVRDLGQGRYLPALIDGLPIASWVRSDGTKMRI